MTVAYNGAAFHGFAKDPAVSTVAGTLEEHLETVLGHAVPLACAGRTDAGVHAKGQVVSFDAAEGRLIVETLARTINALVAPDIAVRDVAVVEPEFDARLSCTSRTYRYSIVNSPVHDPLSDATSWHVAAQLNLAALHAATFLISGSHDFNACCKRNKSRPDESFIRRVAAVHWTQSGDRLQFEITANAYCHHMVRSLVGAFSYVGQGRLTAAEFGALVRNGDRSEMPPMAPARGLVLWSVTYRDPLGLHPDQVR